MRSDLRIRDVRFTPGTSSDVRAGLVGFVAFRAGELCVDAVAVRRTLRGSLTLSYPCRRDRWGHKHPIVCPADVVSRREIEREVLDALGQEVAP